MNRSFVAHAPKCHSPAHAYSANGSGILTRYVQTRSEPIPRIGFWGLRKNQLDALNGSGLKWFVVLLIGPDEKGYLLTSEIVNRCVKDRRWSSADGEFKVHENDDISDAESFATWDDLISDMVR